MEYPKGNRLAGRIMRLKKFFGIFLSLIMVFPFAACDVFKEGGKTSVLWVSQTMETVSDGDETQITFVASDNKFGGYAESGVSGMSDEDTFLSVDLKATAEIPVKVEFVYGSVGDQTVVYSQINIGTEYENYAFRTGNVLSNKSLNKIRLFPSYNAAGGYGILYVKNLTYNDYYLNKFFEVKTVASQDAGENSGNGSGQGDQSGNQGGSGEQQPVVPVTATYLYEKYSQYFKIGMCAGDSDYRNYGDIDGHYNSFTCENEMKLYTIGNNEGQYDYSKADNMLRYMINRGKKIRGHALIWYNGAPQWLTGCRDKQQLLNKIDTYCYNVVKHFKDSFGDSVYCWDVVNEAINDGNGTYRDCFYGVAGIDFIKTAFRAARRADPNAKLFYNDYNMDDRTKRNAVINMLRELINDGVPIDGVGMQAHYAIQGGGVNYETSINNVESAINAFENLAEETGHPLEIHITELDIRNHGNNNAALAQKYKELFEVFRRHSNSITCVTTWGICDAYSWLDNSQGYSGKAYPFLFDEGHNKKAAFDAVFNF